MISYIYIIKLIIIQFATKNYVHVPLKTLKYCIKNIMLFELKIIRYLVENSVEINEAIRYNVRGKKN